jgi:hypothetical protein
MKRAKTVAVIDILDDDDDDDDAVSLGDALTGRVDYNDGGNSDETTAAPPKKRLSFSDVLDRRKAARGRKRSTTAPEIAVPPTAKVVTCKSARVADNTQVITIDGTSSDPEPAAAPEVLELSKLPDSDSTQSQTFRECYEILRFVSSVAAHS